MLRPREGFSIFFLHQIFMFKISFFLLCFILSRWAPQRGERVFNLRNWSWRRRRRWRAGRDVVDNYVKKYNKYKYSKVKQQIQGKEYNTRKANTILLSWSWIRCRSWRWRAGRDIFDKHKHISQVQTQILIKFHLQNLDQALTLKSQPNINLSIKLKLQNLDQT